MIFQVVDDVQLELSKKLVNLTIKAILDSRIIHLIIMSNETFHCQLGSRCQFAPEYVCREQEQDLSTLFRASRENCLLCEIRSGKRQPPSLR
jgi:hypothetical protein